jgi:hypothetical protein
VQRMSVEPAPAPDCEGGLQQLPAARRNSIQETRGKGRCSGSSVPASNSQTRNRRERSSESVSPLPVTATKAVGLSGTIRLAPSGRTST